MYDLIIVGAGPAGVSAAIYASRARIGTLWIDNRFIPGGQISDSGRVDNYPGIPGVSGADLGEKLHAHAKSLGMTPLREKVLSIERQQDGRNVRFVVTTKKNRYEARTVICSAGASHRMLDIPGEQELSGSGVSYCATCDGAFFKDRRTVVIGGGNTACEDALFLARLCREVTLVHRRDELRADAVLQELVRQEPKIRILWNTVPRAIEGEMQVTGLKVCNVVTQEESLLETDGVFIAVGTTPNSALVRDLVQTDPSGYVCAGEDGVTNVPGLFVAGDVRTKQLRQVVTAASDGANCVESVQRYLRSQR